MTYASTTPSPTDCRRGLFRAALFGVLDGLVTNVSLILGFAGANPGHAVVRLAGLAGLVAGAFSMGERRIHRCAPKRNSSSTRSKSSEESLEEVPPDQERLSLRQIFVDRGIEVSWPTASRWTSCAIPDGTAYPHSRGTRGSIPPRRVHRGARRSRRSFVCLGASHSAATVDRHLVRQCDVVVWSVSPGGDSSWAASLAASCDAAGSRARHLHMGLRPVLTYGVGYLVGGALSALGATGRLTGSSARRLFVR